MRRQALTLILASLLIVAGVVSVASAAGKRPGPARGMPVYLALGDSWPAGGGASAPSEGYVPQLNTKLRRRFDCRRHASRSRRGCKHLQLVNLAQGGATTPSMIETQLPAAVALLTERNRDRNRRNDVKVVTLHIGGNDVVFPILGACSVAIDANCVAAFRAAMDAYRSDLGVALTSLRAAAGTKARIVIGTYDNTFVPPCPLSTALGELIGEGSATVGDGFRDVIYDVAERHGVEVADVGGRLGPADLVGDCLHPNDSGHDKVTRAFVEVLTDG